MYRSGIGYDAHRFAEGRPLVLGGVEIPHSQGLLAHSDGDVAIHALCDALLGASGQGDIGRHFPDNDPEFHRVDSRILLREVVSRIHGLNMTVVNVDLTIVAQRPKLAPHIRVMRERLAEDLQVDEGRVNVKATTTEGMGFAGRGEGISSYAVAMLRYLE